MASSAGGGSEAQTESPSPRYRAFISYSQTDKVFASRLHTALERYRVPRGVDTYLPRNRKLGRFFIDDEEMGAATDLDEAVKAAIDAADSLIVLCSARAAQSTWVEREIVYFKRNRAAGRVFAVIADGAPNSGEPATECYPRALRFKVARDGTITNERTEPLGLDWRKERLARLRARLAAGLLDVPFDSLWRRDRRRWRMRTMQVAVAVLALTTAAVLLRQNAENERRNAFSGKLIAQASEQMAANPTLAALLLAELRQYPPTGDGARVAHLAISERISARVLRGDEPIRSVGVSPDGRAILAGYAGGTARIWRLEAATPPTLLNPAKCPSPSGQAPSLVGAAYDASGSRVVTFSVDATARLWTPAGECVRVFPHDNTVRSAAFNKEGTLIVAIMDRSNEVWLWRIDDPRGDAFKLRHRGAIAMAAFGPTTSAGQLLLTLSDGVPRLWTIDQAMSRAESRVLVPEQGVATSAAFSASGRRLAIGTESGAVLLLSSDTPASRPVELRPSARQDAVRRIVFCPDERCLAVIQNDEVHLVDMSGGRRVFEHPDGVNELAFSANGDMLATAGANGRVQVWSKSGGEWSAPSELRGHTAAVKALEFTGDSRHLVTASSDGSARVWPTMPVEPTEMGRVKGDVRTAALDSEGRYAVALSAPYLLSLWRIEDGGVQHLSSLATNPLEYVGVSPNGSFVFGLAGQRLQLWKRVNSELTPFTIDDSMPHSVGAASFTRDGHQLITVDAEQHVWRSQLAAESLGRAQRVLDVPLSAPVLTVSASSDGRRVVTGNSEGTYVWSVPARGDARGAQGLKLQSNADTAMGVMFSSDASRVLTRDAQGIARVFWSDGTGSPIELNNTPLRAAAFNASVSGVIGIAPDGRVLQFRLEWTEMIDALDRSTAACLTVDERSQYLGEDANRALRQAELCEIRKRDRYIVTR
jgi:WD40 repeat protein